MTQFQPQLGNAFYKALGAEDMEPLLAINEIIANSIDSWIEEYCGKKAKLPKLSIDINMSAKQITIQDNAGGMEPGTAVLNLEKSRNAMKRSLDKTQREVRFALYSTLSAILAVEQDDKILMSLFTLMAAWFAFTSRRNR